MSQRFNRVTGLLWFQDETGLLRRGYQVKLVAPVFKVRCSVGDSPIETYRVESEAVVAFCKHVADGQTPSMWTVTE